MYKGPTLTEALAERLRMADECGGRDYDMMAEWAIALIRQFGALLVEDREPAILRAAKAIAARHCSLPWEVWVKGGVEVTAYWLNYARMVSAAAEGREG